MMMKKSTKMVGYAVGSVCAGLMLFTPLGMAVFGIPTALILHKKWRDARKEELDEEEEGRVKRAKNVTDDLDGFENKKGKV